MGGQVGVIVVVVVVLGSAVVVVVLGSAVVVVVVVDVVVWQSNGFMQPYSSTAGIKTTSPLFSSKKLSNASGLT